MDTPQWMQNLENAMVLDLSKHINPKTLEDRWADFDCRLSAHLGTACRARLTSFHQAFTALQNAEKVKIGEYKVLRDMLNPIHVDMGDIIDKYTKRMQTEDGEINSVPVQNDKDDVEEKDYGSYTDASEEIKNLENEMAIELDKYIQPHLTSWWATFDCSLSEHLSASCRAGLKNIYMAINELRNMEKIKIGKYTVLYEMLNPIHAEMGDIIDEYTKKIRSQYEKERSQDVNQ